MTKDILVLIFDEPGPATGQGPPTGGHLRNKEILDAFMAPCRDRAPELRPMPISTRRCKAPRGELPAPAQDPLPHPARHTFAATMPPWDLQCGPAGGVGSLSVLPAVRASWLVFGLRGSGVAWPAMSAVTCVLPVSVAPAGPAAPTWRRGPGQCLGQHRPLWLRHC